MYIVLAMLDEFEDKMIEAFELCDLEDLQSEADLGEGDLLEN